MSNKDVILDPNTKRFRHEEAEMVEEKEDENGLVVTPEEENPPEEEIPDPEENFGEQIREMLADGYSAKDILATGLYKESTVRAEVRRWMKRNGKPTNHNGVVLPVKLEKGNFIPIESELEGIRLHDGEYRIGFIDGLRVLVLGVKLSQMLTANLSETTASQLSLLKEAKSDSEEVAKQTIVEALPYITDAMKEIAKANKPPEVNPLQSMMVRMVEPLMSNALGGIMKVMLPGQPAQSQEKSLSLPPGWTTEGEQR